MKLTAALGLALLLMPAGSCSKEGRGGASAKDAEAQGIECDHDIRMKAEVDHTWPYPAEYRDLRWAGGYAKLELRLKPSSAAFITGSLGVRDGDILRVLDSKIRITKPRRLVAKRDLMVKRMEWSQGVQVERSELAVAKGHVGNFLFYNSQGLCIIGTPSGPGWTECTLDDAFEGLSAQNPFACEQLWWIQVQKRKVDKGWTVVEPGLVERILRETPDPE